MTVAGFVLAVISGVVAGRFHHTVGIAPILAGLLCVSCFLRRRDVAIVGVGAVLIRDLMGLWGWFTLVRLIAILSVIGVIQLFRVRPTLRSLLIGLGVSSPVYHFILATGDWLTRACSQAPLTSQGFWTTLTTAVPYFQRSLISDLLFTSAFLGLYTFAGYLVALRWPSVLPQPSEG